MELNYTALTIAQLEDDLGCKLVDLFLDEEASMETALSTKKMLALISAGYNNDYAKGNEVFMSKLRESKGEFYGEALSEIIEALQGAGFLTMEKEDAQKTQKLNHGEELSKKLKASENSGVQEK